MDADLERPELPLVAPFYFASGEQELFGVHYSPLGRDIDQAVLICPAYSHEYKRAHRNLQQLAIQLARKGCHVLRFDYSATGKSTGTRDLANLKTWRKDVMSAAEFLRQRSQTRRLSLVGVRLGATLASRCNVPNVQSLVLWDPLSGIAALCQLLDEFHEQVQGRSMHFPALGNRMEVDGIDDLPMTSTKQAESQVVLLQQATQSANRRYLVASRGYLSQPSLTGLPDDWQVHQTGEAACWCLPESIADFSTPEAKAAIVSILADGRG